MDVGEFFGEGERVVGKIGIGGEGENVLYFLGFVEVPYDFEGSQI